MTLLRAYENGKPARITNFLNWSEKCVQEKDLIFVAGTPESSARLYAVEQFKSTIGYSAQLRKNYGVPALFDELLGKR